MTGYKKISIVIPIYNEKATLRKLITRVKKANTLGLTKEIVLVDDGSTDGTRKILTELAGRNVKTILLKKNHGKGYALRQGFKATTGDIVLIQDADLEYDPSDYVTLLQPFISRGADVVYGSRFLSSEARRVLFFWHLVVNKLLTLLSNILSNLNISDMETGYKVFRGELIRKLASQLVSDRFGFEPEITARIAKMKNLTIYEVGISYAGRTYSEGKKISWRDGALAFWQIIYYNLFV